MATVRYSDWRDLARVLVDNLLDIDLGDDGRPLRNGEDGRIRSDGFVAELSNFGTFFLPLVQAALRREEIDVLSVSSLTNTSLVATLASPAEEEGGVTQTGSTSVTASGTALLSGSAAATITGITFAGTNSYAAAGLTSMTRDSGQSTLTVLPFATTPSVTLLRDSSAESDTEIQARNNVPLLVTNKGSSSYEGAVVVQADGSFLGQIKELTDSYSDRAADRSAYAESYVIRSSAGFTVNHDFEFSGTIDTLQFSRAFSNTGNVNSDPSRVDFRSTGPLTGIGEQLTQYAANGVDAYEGLAAALLAGGDRITGATNADNLRGFAGNDTLDAGSGNDTLEGGTGADRLTGGTGSDTFVLRAGDAGITQSTMDSIQDFRAVQGDVVQIRGIAADAGKTIGGSSANFAAVIAAANADFAAVAGSRVYFGTVRSTGYVLADTDGNGEADLGVILTGVRTLTADRLVLGLDG